MEIIKPNMRKQVNWSKESCKEEALKYKSRTEFKVKCGAAYNIAYKNGWLNECCLHMKVRKRENGYWTKERCHREAMKYKTRTEFSKGSGGAYTIAKRHKWLDQICEHMKVIGSEFKRAIYAFEFADNYVYIGLSYNVHIRKQGHLADPNSPVSKHINNSCADYSFRRLTKYKNVQEAIRLEAYFIEDYKNNGWQVLNLRDAGALGGSRLKWTFDKCLKESLKYKTRKEFKKGSASAYGATIRHKWQDEICAHMVREQHASNYWNFERCKKEALNYSTRTEFNRKSGSAYSAAWKRGWLDIVCSHMETRSSPEPYWIKERCQEEALKYRTRKEFKKGTSAAYSSACKNGWLDEICSHMITLRKSVKYWTKERCKEEALKYRSRSTFQRGCASAYRKAHNRGWLDEICSHMTTTQKPTGYWTKERCQTEALKYSSKADFARGSNSAYKKAWSNHWLNEICSHMAEIRKPNGYWTKNKCHEIAKNYTTKADFRKHFSGAYAKAIRNGWINEICSHMMISRKPSGYWTRERCIEEAAKYDTKSEFQRKAGGACLVARGQGWFDEIWEKTHPGYDG